LKAVRTIPPAAAPVRVRALLRGFAALFRGGRSSEIEREIARHFGSASAFLTSSGKAAFVLILKGLASLRHRKKVVIPAYTCYSVPSAILKAGLEIALCDVDPDTLDFDFGQLATVADEQTLCVVSTHLFGVPSDVERARTTCAGKGIAVVEDAAQAMGVEIDGRMLGTVGDAGFFSLGRGKNISCGSGGIVVTSSPELAGALRYLQGALDGETIGSLARTVLEACLMKVFLNPSLYWFPAGIPFLGIGETRFLSDFPMRRLGEFKAGMLDVWKETLEEYNRCRSANGRRYISELGLPKTRGIYSRDLPYLRLPVYANGAEGKALLCRRWGFLGASPMYPGPVHRIEEIRDRFAEASYPGAERVAATLVTLPTHVLVADSDRRRLCDALRDTGFDAGPGGNAWRQGPSEVSS